MLMFRDRAAKVKFQLKYIATLSDVINATVSWQGPDYMGEGALQIIRVCNIECYQ